MLPRPDPLAFLEKYPEYAGYEGGEPLCNQDTDCVSAPHGYCEISGFGQGLPMCLFGCLRDTDCGPGQACLCGEPVGMCVPVSCQRDSDCPSGLLCASQVPGPSCTPVAFACQTPEDECTTNADCGDAGRCRVSQAIGRRVCGTGELSTCD